ncbi:MAG TPA: hypothetical protein VMF32_24195 [Xanthobacteraceae bacterium]|nr:hypothetical protein [Xanthobacteraceae bacterium]
MKFLIASFCLLVTASTALAGVVTPRDAAAHVGQVATVEGQVSEVHTARSGKATFIDMGGSYPNNAFTAVIFARNMADVGDVSSLTGKTIDTTGKVGTYAGRPEIIVTSRSQIVGK